MKKSAVTQELVNTFPPWARTRTDAQAPGYALLNVMAQPMERMQKALARAGANTHVATANLDEIDWIYKIELPIHFDFEVDMTDPIVPLPIPPLCSGLINGEWHVISNSDPMTVEAFWYNSVPNRTSIEQTLSGVHFHDYELMDMPASGMTESGLWLHHLDQGEMWIECVGGVRYIQTINGELYRGRVLLKGINAQGQEDQEVMIFPWDMRQKTFKQWRSISSVASYDMEDSVEIILTSANFNAEDRLDPYNMAVSPDRKKVDTMYKLEGGWASAKLVSQAGGDWVSLCVDDEHIYWGNGLSHAIYKADLDGQNVTMLQDRPGAEPDWATVDDTNIYWTEWLLGNVCKANKEDGSNFTIISSGLNRPGDIIVDDEYIFWTVYGSGSIADGLLMRSDLDGGNITTLVSGLLRPLKVLRHDEYLFWCEEGNAPISGKIGRCDIDGSNTLDLVSGVWWPEDASMSSDGEFVYFACWHTTGTSDPVYIEKMRLDGSDRSVLLQCNETYCISVTDSRIFWSEYANKRIMTSNLDGTNIRQLDTTDVNPTSVVFHNNYLYWSSWWTRLEVHRISLLDDKTTSTLKRVGYVSDEWQQLILGFIEKEDKERWELLDEDGIAVQACDIALQPFTDRTWVATTSGLLYCYDTHSEMVSGLDLVKTRTPGSDVQLDLEDKYVLLGEEITFIPWHARPVQEITKWRVWYQTPSGTKYGMLDGSQVAFSTDFWVWGKALSRNIGNTFSILAEERGEYLIVLEAIMTDETTHIEKVIVPVNFKRPLTTINTGLSGVLGIDFDADQKLWVRTASAYYQLDFHTDIMLVDFDKKVLYFKEPYETVNISS